MALTKWGSKPFILAIILTGFGLTNADALDYKDQANWVFESGKAQSPINIDEKMTKAMHGDGKMALDYAPNAQKIAGGSHGLAVIQTGDARITGRQFTLQQLHFHTPSEHTFNGEHKALEGHFVHKAEDGRLAVVGVLFDVGPTNTVLDTLLSRVGQSDVPLDLSALLPKDKSYYHYLGSLTTPPLTENVEWYVLRTPMTLSKAQLKKIHKIERGNNRAVQDVNERAVLLYQE